MVDYDSITINEYATLNDIATVTTVPTSFLIRDFDITNTAIRTES